jgi:hypothetical protein
MRLENIKKTKKWKKASNHNKNKVKFANKIMASKYKNAHKN